MTEKRTIFAFVQRRKRRAKRTFLPFKFQTIGNQLVQYGSIGANKQPKNHYPIPNLNT